MKFSFMTINRILEETMAEDGKLRSVITRQGKVTLSRGRELSDAELVEKLAGMGISIDRANFAEMSRPFLSAQEMWESLAKAKNTRVVEGSHDEDWLWIALECLWERWLPDRPSLEMIDDRMQAGYDAFEDDDEAEVCRVWLDVWRNVLAIIDERQMSGIDEFDDQFAGTQSVFNWLSDFDRALGNAARDDPDLMRQRVDVCRIIIERFSDIDDLLVENFKRALAESLRQLGNATGADALYSQWLNDDPKWGWGWIGWSDDHYLFATEGQADGDRAVEILRQGLTNPGVRDRDDLLERFIDLCHELGRSEEAKAAELELRELNERNEGMWQASEDDEFGFSAGLPEAWPLSIEDAYGDDDLPADTRSTRKVGRNEPCPCGSGKKYKKCCMSRLH